MAPTGREHFRSLRNFYRASSYRRFRVVNRNNRAAEILGFGPNGDTMIGWWDGGTDLRQFDPDDVDWANHTVYV